METPILNVCKHSDKYKIAEREFFYSQKNKFSGTLIICKKCGDTEFIKDKRREK